MADRRKGTTLFWDAFWKFIYGERRSGKDRRNWVYTLVTTPGCNGRCRQGREQCDCKRQKEKS